MYFVTFADAFAWLESFTNYEKHPPSSVNEYNLDRMRLMLEVFGNPQNAFKSVHIAGSKGKGSTAAFIAAALTEGGYKTGLYTSPHVTTYKERITLSGAEFPDREYVSVVNTIADRLRNDPALAPAMEGAGPTTFELLTLLGFLMFKAAGCEWAVIEAGLGGRLDATNVVLPEIAVITPVELEHTEILGKTIEKIASEKAGIMKPGRPACMGYQKPEAAFVFSRKALELGIPLHNLPEEAVSISATGDGPFAEADIVFKAYPHIRALLSMPGDFQAENAALAALTLYHLFPEGLNGVPVGESIEKGFSHAKLPGRMEIISLNPTVVIDGAHTPASTERLSNAFTSLYGEEGVLLFGCVSDKDASAMAGILCRRFKEIVVSTPGTYKKSDPLSVFSQFKALNPETRFEPDPKKALSLARDLSAGIRPILVTGSFYMAAEIRKLSLPLIRA